MRMCAIVQLCNKSEEEVRRIRGRGNRPRQSLLFERKMVGTTGFEPATSRTPSVRATRLRHVPSNLPKYPCKIEIVKYWPSYVGEEPEPLVSASSKLNRSRNSAATRRKALRSSAIPKDARSVLFVAPVVSPEALAIEPISCKVIGESGSSPPSGTNLNF